MNTSRSAISYCSMAFAFLALVGCSNPVVGNSEERPAPNTKATDVMPEKTEGRTITLESANWQFTPSSIVLKKGEQVSLELKGVEGDHGINIPGLGISAKMNAGESTTVSIPTDKPGTYQFFCNVPCGPGHTEMKGTIVIE